MVSLRSVLLASLVAAALTSGTGGWQLTNKRNFRSGATARRLCPEKLEAVYADMHDGDKKKIAIEGHVLTIKPSDNDHKWIVIAKLDVETCSAVVDFNVPGKPNPPPVSLTATLWWSSSSVAEKTVFEFTDMTGTLAAKDFPLNRWVELTWAPSKVHPVPCPTSFHEVYADMHDGDKKAIEISGTSMSITPSGNKQQWRVDARLDRASCTASIDFKVEGKPSPPPVSLKAFLLSTVSAAGGEKTEFEFTDPTGKLAAADFPLNHWVQVGA